MRDADHDAVAVLPPHVGEPRLDSIAELAQRLARRHRPRVALVGLPGVTALCPELVPRHARPLLPVLPLVQSLVRADRQTQAVGRGLGRLHGAIERRAVQRDDACVPERLGHCGGLGSPELRQSVAVEARVDDALGVVDFPVPDADHAQPHGRAGCAEGAPSDW